MLGTELSLLLEERGVPFAGTDREVDITSPGSLASFAGNRGREEAVTWIVNCAAYTAVDKAEDDRDLCRRLNAGGAANIARTARNIGARLIHLSTDYVFNGRGVSEGGSLRPYRETDGTGPACVYGLTKRDGELAVLENNPRSYIVRTMLRLMNERGEVNVVDAQRGSPTWARGLAETLCAVIAAEAGGRRVPYGVYHYTDEGETTWHGFALEIYRLGRMLGLINKDCAVKPCASAEFPARAARPAYSVLDKAKIKAALGMKIPEWGESLARYLADLAEDRERKPCP
jgi:dTDP-4-dehydrorhamnose reductase